MASEDDSFSLNLITPAATTAARGGHKKHHHKKKSHKSKGHSKKSRSDHHKSSSSNSSSRGSGRSRHGEGERQFKKRHRPEVGEKPAQHRSSDDHRKRRRFEGDSRTQHATTHAPAAAAEAAAPAQPSGEPEQTAASKPAAESDAYDFEAAYGDGEAQTGSAGGAGGGAGASAQGNRVLGSRKNPVRVAGKHHAMVVHVPHARQLPVGAASTATTAKRASAEPGKQAETFDALGVSDSIVKQLTTKLGLHRPTMCQSLAVPVLMQGADVLLKSETGSGKTLAYLLPIVHELLSRPQRLTRGEGTQALVLAPTRELCSQISDVLQRLLQPFYWLVPGSVTGGEKKKSEKARLRKGVTVLVATPGRLLDHLHNTKSFSVSGLRWLVLDEADRLMDMGFEAQVAEILEALSRAAAGPQVEHEEEEEEEQRSSAARQAQKYQTVLVSATITGKIEQLAGQSLLHPEFIDADAASSTNASSSSHLTFGKTAASGDQGGDDSDGGDSADDDADGTAVASSSSAFGTAVAAAAQSNMLSTPEQLQQFYMVIPAKWRLVTLFAMLRMHMRSRLDCKIIVFFSTCASVDFHFHLFASMLRHIVSPRVMATSVDGNATAAAKPGADLLFKLHGNESQAARVSSFRGFCGSKAGILLATDVAARGLDLPVVPWIIQMDPPSETSEYVHRVGRTARRGLGGSALLALMPSEQPYVQVLAQRSLRLIPVDSDSVLATLLNEVPPFEALMADARAADVVAGAFTPGDGSHNNSGSGSKSGRHSGGGGRGDRGDRGGGGNSGGGGAGGTGEGLDIEKIKRILSSARIAMRGKKGGRHSSKPHKPSTDKKVTRRDIELWAVRWQVYMEEWVASHEQALDLARAAFSAFSRSYATHSRDTRHIFHVRALHLGHVAKSFALREQPTVAVSAFYQHHLTSPQHETKQLTASHVSQSARGAAARLKASTSSARRKRSRDDRGSGGGRRRAKGYGGARGNSSRGDDGPALRRQPLALAKQE